MTRSTTVSSRFHESGRLRHYAVRASLIPSLIAAVLSIGAWAGASSVAGSDGSSGLTPDLAILAQATDKPAETRAPGPLDAHDRDLLRLNLEPIPVDASQPRVDEQRAIAISQELFGRSDQPVLVEHGVAEVMTEVTASAWLVVYKVADAEPLPAGPVCPEGEGACSAMKVELVGGLFSDETGELLRSFSKSEQVEPEAPVPAE